MNQEVQPLEEWRNLLRVEGHRTVQASYGQAVVGSQTTWFDYVNDSTFPELTAAFILTAEGKAIDGVSPKHFRLNPGEALHIDLEQWLKEVGLSHFVGGLFLVQRFEPPHHNEKKLIRDIMNSWHAGSHHAQFGNECDDQFNIKSRIGKYSFFMFCPAALSTDEMKTLAVVFNHSQDFDYNDTVAITPRLNDSSGNSWVGEPIAIKPFGFAAIDVERHFSQFPFKKNQYYSLSVSHVGHRAIAMFFHVLRDSGAIITSRHTQPAACIFRPTEEDYFFNIMREFKGWLPRGAVRFGKRLMGRPA